MRVTFYGVRGSTPCCSPSVSRFGGNTSCVVVEPSGSTPIILDLGTGLRVFGCRWPTESVFHGTALVSHMHWDHVQGLPFFGPAVRAGNRLDIYGPRPEDGGTLAAAFDAFIKPPYFPVTIDQLPADIRLHVCSDQQFQAGNALVTAREVPHCGRTLGYRIEHDGVAIAYIPDHQQPFDGSYGVADSVLELCRDADLVIHDSQYTDAEFAQKFNWGHCTVGYAVEVAIQAGAKRLALFHHDPSHTDDVMDHLSKTAGAMGQAAGVDVFAAQEGQQVEVISAGYAHLT